MVVEKVPRPFKYMNQPKSAIDITIQLAGQKAKPKWLRV